METLKLAKNYLKDDGILLIAVNNRFGMKNWKGKDNYEILLGVDKENRTEYGKNKIKNMIEALGFINYKFYNIFPEYKAPNIIYSNEHKLTLEDISRDLELNDEEDLNNFSEIEVLREVLKEGEDKLEFFVNSFLIEISKNIIKNDVKYVSFTNSRKASKQIETIIFKDKVVKKAVTKEAKAHIEAILENAKHFPRNNCNLLDRKGEGVSIESDFIYSKRLDEVIISSNDVKKEFDKYKDVIFQNIVPFENIDKKELLEPLKVVDEEVLKKLNFVEYGFIDMIPKNCFVVGGMNFFFDQEWMLKWIPAEFILFRAIRYTSNIDQGELLKFYNLNEFLKCFEDLDNYFQDTVLDKNKFKMIVRANNTTRYRLEVAEKELEKKKQELVQKEELLTQKDNEIMRKRSYFKSKRYRD